MLIARTIAEMRAARPALGRLGFVPTMGALHAGHLSLIELAAQAGDAVAASIFVNPTQFAPGEDLAKYPRPLEADLAKLATAGVAIVFLPQPDDIYPAGFSTSIQVGPIADRLEGAVRPGHFAGVATVVAKLFAIVTPNRAYFGQKDYQQTRIVRRMVRDLDLPVEIAIGPTVREADGLALSSRNVYLDPADRAEATALSRGLAHAEAACRAGERDAAALKRIVAAEIAETRGAIDYISIADRDDLDELPVVDAAGAVLSLAVRFGSTRLLDNVLLVPGA